MISKRPTPFKDYLSLAPIILLGLVMLALLVSANWPLADRYGKGEEFLPAWNGWRAFIFEKMDPYSDTVAVRTQVAVYGRAARQGESPYALDVPFPLLILYIPFAFIPDPVWARAAFMALSEIGLLALILLSIRLLDWRPRAWFIILFCVLWFTSFFTINSILAGSSAILLTLGVVGAIHAFRAENDEVAGMLLALVSFHWQAMILLWLMLVISVYLARRWRVFVGYAMVWVVLGGITFITFMSSPGWLIPYLRALVSNLRAESGLALASSLAHWLPASLEDYLKWIPAALIILLAVEWIRALRATDTPRWMWVAGFSLAVTPLIGFNTTISNLAPLAFSILCILPFAHERWRRFSYPILSIFILIIYALPYYLQWHFQGDGLLADEVTYLSFCALVIVGLYWVRWYAVRPPRTWADGVKRELQK